MSKWWKIFAFDVVSPTRYRLLGIFPFSLCCLLFACAESPSLCEVTTTSKLLTYMLNMASYSDSNLFISIKNTNKPTVVTHSFASLMPELHPNMPNKLPLTLLWLGTVLHSGLSDAKTCNYPRMRIGAARRFSSRSLYKHGILDYIYWVCFYSIASKTSEINWYILDMYDAVRQ